jgi:ornithine cyclodeaminase
MLAFARQTGELSAVLLDGGLLTRVRTGVAGAIAARYLAPSDVHNIGVIGAGNQARWQIRMLKNVVSCREVQVYCQEHNEIDPYIRDMQAEGFTVAAADSAEQIAEECQLIVTTTPSRKPVLPAERVTPGTHITAVGADTPGKQELEAELFRRADLVVGDSKAQCEVRGECAHAIKEGALDPRNIVELGTVIDGSKEGRTREDQITIADLTGVAVQDIAITRSIIAAASG